MSRRARRVLRRTYIEIALRGLLFVVVVGLALIASVGADPWMDPAHRSTLIPASLLVAYAVGSLVAGSRRRRT
jgi:hypothetical protein